MSGRVISRGEWGARYAAGFGSRRIGSLDKILHHDVMPNTPGAAASLSQDIAAMRRLEAVGQQRFGRGVSYSFAIARSGRVFEGVPIDRIGAHTSGHNRTGAGIVLMGNYDVEPPTPQQLAAAAWLLQHGQAARWWRLRTITWGHRQVKPAGTACPGRYGYASIPTINALAAGEVLPVSNPVSNPLPPSIVDKRPRNADGSLRLERDGIRGRATIGRWQEVMRTPIDFVITPPPVGSTLIEADQAFLNGVLQPQDIASLTGKPRLDEDGVEGEKTIRARQFWLFNIHGPAVLGRDARIRDFDGIAGEETTKLHQAALNAATSGSGRY